MITLIGLGNPGPEYEHSRHNIGRRILAHFMEKHGFSGMVRSDSFAGNISNGIVDGKEVMVLFPNTYMNESGAAAKKLALKGVVPENIVVVHDELDLPSGSFKVSYGSGSGGHHGVDSIVAALGTKDFVRVRVGISPTSFFGHLKKPHGAERVSRFVLGILGRKEEKQLDALL